MKILDFVKRKGRILVIFAVIIASAIAITVQAQNTVRENTSAMDESIQGIVYARDVSINTKIPGRITKIYIEEGSLVKKGDVLVEISSEEISAKKAQILAQIRQAEAGVEASQAIVDMAQANYNAAKERISQAQAGVEASKKQRDMAKAIKEKADNGARTQEVAKAESACDLWKSTYDRAQALFDGGAISAQKLDEIKTQYALAEQTLDMAREGARVEDKDAADAQLALAETGIVSSSALLNQAQEGANAALAQLNQAQAGMSASTGKLEQAKAALQEVEVYLSDTVIKAPIDGYVTALNSDEGELVSTGTSIGTISNLDTCWVDVNLDEDKLSGVSEGQTVYVSFLAFPNNVYEGRIVSINKQPDFAVKKATSENGNFDIVSFGVKVELVNNDNSLRPGMTAAVKFNNEDDGM